MIVEGTPEHVAKTAESHTGRFLAPAARSVELTAADARDDAWEQHAGWWQEQFTDGADPEYEEQILPLVDAAPRRRAPCARRRDAARASSRAASRRSALDVVGIDPTQGADRRGRGARRRAAVRRGRWPTSCRAVRGVVRRASSMCLVLEHIDPIEPPIDEIAAGARARAAASCCFLNHPLLQTPGSGWIDDQILGEQYWRVGPYLPDDERLEEVAPGVDLPFMHRPLVRYINVMADVGLLVEHMDEPPPPPGFVASKPPGVPRSAHDPAADWCCRTVVAERIAAELAGAIR